MDTKDTATDFETLATNYKTAKYETPLGGFDIWEEAAAACERADFDPCTCINYKG